MELASPSLPSWYAHAGASSASPRLLLSPTTNSSRQDALQDALAKFTALIENAVVGSTLAQASLCKKNTCAIWFYSGGKLQWLVLVVACT